MHSTLNPKQTDPPNVLIARAYEQIARADKELERVDEILSNLENDAARHRSDPQTHMTAFRAAAVNNVQVPGDRPSLGGRAVRGFTGLMLTACICVAAIAWQSSYGDAAKQIIASWAPQLVPTSSVPLENPGLPARPSPPTVQAAVVETAPPQPEPLAQIAPEDVAPTAAAPSPELAQLLQTMAGDLATVGQGIEQLKANQEQMARVIAKASEQSLRPRIPAPLPRPTAAPTRKPVPTLPPPQATAQPQAE
jgi:hypothetical protein